jgi:hypothetical protein
MEVRTMSVLLLMAALLAAAPNDGAASPAPAATEKPQAAPRTGRELEQAISAALGRWAKPSEDQAEPAAREFLALYKELQADTSLARSTRDLLSLKLRSRLAALEAQIAKAKGDSPVFVDTKTGTVPKQAVPRRPRDAGQTDSAGVAAQQQVLAQMGGMRGWGPQPGPFGGPGLCGGQPAPGPLGPANNDAGEDLVELIQTTIAPSTWQRVGGPGTIYYWRPGLAIVVHASEDVHEQIGGFMQQMNRLGP